MIEKPNYTFVFLWRFSILGMILWAQWIRFPETQGWKHFVYYTNQTNLFGLLLCSWLLLTHFTCKIPAPPTWLHAGISFWLTTTMIVYWTLLFSRLSLIGGLTPTLFAGYVLHALTPTMILLDWLFFAPHGTLRIHHAFYWLSYPLYYSIWIFLRAELGTRLTDNSRYPYHFMDLDWLQGTQILLYMGTLAAGFLLLGLLMVGADRWIGRKIRPPNPKI